MARKRMIDPSFWTDEKLGECSLQERLLFMGLISHADDEGYGRANPKLIKSSVFPYDDLRASDIEKWLSRLGGLKLVVLYQIDGQTYYYLPNFKKHQTINKPTKSTLPKPEGDMTGELREDYGSSTVALPPNKNEGNLKEENNPHDPPSGSGRRCDHHAKPLLLWEKINGRPITEFESARIIDLSNTYGEEWLADAMKVAGDSSKRKLNYVEGILNRWQTDGKDSVKGKRCSHFPDDSFPRLEDICRAEMQEMAREKAKMEAEGRAT